MHSWWRNSFPGLLTFLFLELHMIQEQEGSEETLIQRVPVSLLECRVKGWRGEGMSSLAPRSGPRTSLGLEIPGSHKLGDHRFSYPDLND